LGHCPSFLISLPKGLIGSLLDGNFFNIAVPL
jgi:hypothetical protein